VRNIHQRKINIAAQEVGILLDSLSSNDDKLWPSESWPRMKFDKPLQAGAKGGHGPIRYFVESYQKGKSIKFRFTGPKGFDGFHEFTIEGISSTETLLKHSLIMNSKGIAIFTWVFGFRPLHDALVEDAFDKAEMSLGISSVKKSWSGWVRFLRWTLGKFR
jgi:hypothetical protein